MKLHRLNQIKNHSLTVLYGTNGVGKSTVIGSLPGKVLIIDTDNGLESVEGLGEDCVVAICDDYTDVVEALGFYKDFDSIAIDTFDKVQEFAIKSAMESDGKVYGKDNVGLNHYGSASQILMQLINDIVQIARDDKNVLVLVHDKQLESEDYDKKTHKTVTPALMPKVGASLMASARIVGFLYKEFEHKFSEGKKTSTEVYRGQFGGNPNLTTKVTRKPSVKAPNRLTNVTWKKMQSLITGVKPGTDTRVSEDSQSQDVEVEKTSGTKPKTAKKKTPNKGE